MNLSLGNSPGGPHRVECKQFLATGYSSTKKMYKSVDCLTSYRSLTDKLTADDSTDIRVYMANVRIAFGIGHLRAQSISLVCAGRRSVVCLCADQVASDPYTFFFRIAIRCVPIRFSHYILRGQYM